MIDGLLSVQLTSLVRTNEMGKIKPLLREARIANIKKAVTNQPWLGRITNK